MSNAKIFLIKAALAGAIAVLLVGCGGNTPYLDRESEVELGPRLQGGKIDSSLTPESLIRVGDNLSQTGRYQAALGFYRRAGELDPENLRALMGMGKALQALGAHEQAERVFDQVLRILPEHPEAREGKTIALINLGKEGEALAYLQRTLDQMGGDPKLYNLIGLTHDLRGENEQAQLSYGRGLDLEPDDTALRNNLALSFALEGEFEVATVLLEEIAQESGAKNDRRQNLALIYGMADRPDLAAAVSRLDLGEREIERNLAYYQTLRQLGPRARARAVLLGEGRPGSATQAANLTNDGATTDTPLAIAPIEEAANPATDPLKVESEPGVSAQAPAISEYRIQLALYRTVDNALEGWANLKRDNRILDQYSPSLKQVAAGSDMGTYYRLQIAQVPNEETALNICMALQGARVDCLILSAQQRPFLEESDFDLE